MRGNESQKSTEEAKVVHSPRFKVYFGIEAKSQSKLAVNPSAVSGRFKLLRMGRITMNAVHQAILEEVKSLGEHEAREVLDFAAFLRGRQKKVQQTRGVNGGSASLGQTRIAVWMLEEARRAGLRDGEILEQYPDLKAQDLVAAWDYVTAHPSEIDAEILENENV